MSDEFLGELHERLVKGRSKRATCENVFLRGWNAGIDFAIKQIRLTCDEPIEDEVKSEDAA